MTKLPLILVALASSGCASPTIVRSDAPIQLMPHANARFAALKVVRRGDSMIVSGDIQSIRSLMLKGHVDITGFSEGIEIDSTTANLIYFIPRRPAPAYFRARLIVGSEKPEFVRLSYHPRPKHFASE